jgi:hypothetical protein
MGAWFGLGERLFPARCAGEKPKAGTSRVDVAGDNAVPDSKRTGENM